MQWITFEQLERAIQAQCDTSLEEFQTTIRHATEASEPIGFTSFFLSDHAHNLYGLSKLVNRLYVVDILEPTEREQLLAKIDATIEHLYRLEHEYHEQRLKDILQGN